MGYVGVNLCDLPVFKSVYNEGTEVRNPRR